ncbi:hypothetical protein DUI87_11775 [Hirundo rustica rustica]|uniref:Uncharacterized protein n=1 Tax=Hirundo rustica rustica TaxID=333673 RepID=A0A3M0KEN4_HIRRU|nr:hypothetical protein DUI87_11775 [Hirundo rustica rustica]
MPLPAFGAIALDLNPDLELTSSLVSDLSFHQELPGVQRTVPDPCSLLWTCLAWLTRGLWDCPYSTSFPNVTRECQGLGRQRAQPELAREYLAKRGPEDRCTRSFSHLRGSSGRHDPKLWR